MPINRRLTILFLVVIAAGVALLLVTRSHADAIRVEHETDTQQTHIRIDAADGQVQWAQVLAGIARAKGFDDSALDGVLPDGAISLQGRGTTLLIWGINTVLKPRIGIAVEDDALVVTLDRNASFASKRRMVRMLTEGIVNRKRPGWTSDFALELDEDWDRADPSSPLVILVHGLNSAPERTCIALDELRAMGAPVGALRYPNDQPIIDSAAMFSAELERLAAEHPARKVRLVCHSMGGLVARAMLENPELDPGNVDRLVMVATPNHGSGLARFAFGFEVYEHVKLENRPAAERLYAAIEDGLEEASTDLTPGSAFLTQLNARERNPRVRYSIFLGNAGKMSDEELIAMRRKVAQAGERNRFARFFGSKLDRWLANLDEVVAGKGDGAVSIESGMLEGVDDVTILEMDHSTHGGPQVREQLLAAIRARVMD